ncbi:MAG: AAA family ATPase [Okeania sp. SIO3I5]|uniref:NB-ARC domain-containing protein n=1 Tax=Okeania sp. SIO3I5 TaxID=2607805 RepID=UPI0013BB8588|nr:NB-ARC domain-containing protein [Okeania sp. SIO3I5]NEQ39305.1 AAA family ATPase [Okeania sp. SIO3I5]
MAATIAASEKGLKIIDMARKKKGWNKAENAWWGLAKTSKATLKRFWQGIAIQREVFINICETVGVNWEEIVDNNPLSRSKKKDFFAYDYAWVGREKLVAELTEKIQDTCRVTIIVGIAGIGKTALAEKVVSELDWNQFHLENFEPAAKTSDFASVASRWLEMWGDRLQEEDRRDTRRLLNRLVKRLQDNEYLILMDSVENIMEGNEEEGWNNFRDEWWGKFFESLFAAESCQSRIILTSQDLPHQIPERYKNFWHCIPLGGLADSEQLELFEKTGLEVDTDLSTRQYLQRIGAAYEGHPLALRVISGEIGAKPFDGNVVAYWKKYGYEIEEVEKAIAEAKSQGIREGAEDEWNLDRYTRKLRKNVRERLEKTFGRLKRDTINSYRLLCEGSIYRCAVTEKFWLNHLQDWDCDQDEADLALEILRDRFLVEEVVENDDVLVRQHNLIRSVALEHHKKLEEYEQDTDFATDARIVN